MIRVLIVASVACLEISFDDVDRLHLGRLGAGRLKIKETRDQQTETAAPARRIDGRETLALVSIIFDEVGVEFSQQNPNRQEILPILAGSNNHRFTASVAPMIPQLPSNVPGFYREHQDR